MALEDRSSTSKVKKKPGNLTVGLYPNDNKLGTVIIILHNTEYH